MAIRDQDGEIVAKYEYDAWGNVTVMNGNGSLVISDNSIGNINPFRYRGYYYDTETGFYYLQTRYYDPEICRFINADDYELLDILAGSIGQLNMYQYCGNNPVMYIDPTGEFVWALFFIGFAIGAATGAIDAYLNGDNIVAGAIIGGLVGGIISGGGFGFFPSSVISAIGSMATDVVNEREIDWNQAVVNGVIGGIFSIGSNKISSLTKADEQIVQYWAEAIHGTNMSLLQIVTSWINQHFNGINRG